MPEYEEDEEAEGMSRRQFVKYSLAAGVVGLAGSSVATFKSIVPGEGTEKGELRLTFHYTRPGGIKAPLWWLPLIGQKARPEHFKEWDGASVWWRGRFDAEGNLLPNAGMPALLIRVPPELIEAPEDYDGYLADEGILAFNDKCVHLCCNPGWHLNAVSEQDRAFVPKLAQNDQDPIFCICHLSQYDPLTLVWNRHPTGATYVGAKMVHGPADRALPAIPIKLVNGEIVGDSDSPKWNLGWYDHCR